MLWVYFSLNAKISVLPFSQFFTNHLKLISGKKENVLIVSYITTVCEPEDYMAWKIVYVNVLDTFYRSHKILNLSCINNL